MSDLATVNATIDGWLEAVEILAAGVARGIAVEAFHFMLPISPQYSGDFVANWNVSVDGPDESFTPIGLRARRPVAIGGDEAAQSIARARAIGKASDFRLGQTIYITNASQHDGNFYAPLIEAGQIRFRPGNSGAVVANTVQAMTSRARPLTSGEALALAAQRF